MSEERFADGEYVVIMGDSGRGSSDVRNIVKWLNGNGFDGNVGNVAVTKDMGGKVLFDYRKKKAPDSFWKTFGDGRGHEIMDMAEEWSRKYSKEGEPVWACPRIVVADIAAGALDGKIEELVVERWPGFEVFYG